MGWQPLILLYYLRLPRTGIDDKEGHDIGNQLSAHIAHPGAATSFKVQDSRDSLPAPPSPHSKGLGRCHSAAAAWRLERQRLTLAPHPNAWGTREFPAGGYTAPPGRRGPPVPPARKERPHALQAMRATPRPKKTGPEQATKRGGAAGAPVPRVQGARPGRRLHPLPSAEQSAAGTAPGRPPPAVPGASERGRR